MAALITIALLLIWHLFSMLFAGMKGCEQAKKRWTITCVVGSVLWGIAMLWMKGDSDAVVLVKISLIVLGIVAAYALNIAGKFCIDLIASILPDNRTIDIGRPE